MKHTAFFSMTDYFQIKKSTDLFWQFPQYWKSRHIVFIKLPPPHRKESMGIE